MTEKISEVNQQTFIAEYLDLTLEHVGRRIELVYTPVRDDGLRGKPISIVSDIIAPGKGNVSITCTSVCHYQRFCI